jgi:DNA invertase Pin-like site-specific DNA recombinase
MPLGENPHPEGTMSRQRRLAVSYSRFSSPKQSKGDSADRQDRLFRQFCQMHNLTPSGEVYADRGLSGYKDEHRKKGRLGQLVAFAKEGRFEPGTVIVVEAWDRLGRLRPDKMTELVAELVRLGLGIGVCRLNDVFVEEDFGTHKWTTLAVFIQLAYQESKQKAERVAASWETRRKKARSDRSLVGGNLPAWVEKAKDGALRLIPERAAVVKRIFRLAAEGLGHTRIVRALVAEKVQPFGEFKVNPERVRSQFSGRWTTPYVALLLRDRRAVGEFQPRKGDVADGPPIPGYFPAAVTEAEWLLARAGQEERLWKDGLGRRIGPRQRKYVNVFRGLLTHARDGEGFLLHNKGSSEAPQLLLINASGEGGRDRCYTFPYGVFEEKVLGLLREVDPREVLPRPAEAPSRADVLRARLAQVRADIASLKSDLKPGYNKALAEVLRDRSDEEEKVGQELQEELAKAARPAEKAWRDLPSLVDMIRSADDPDAVRLRLRPVLRRVVERMQVLIVPRGAWRICAVQAHFTEGDARRDYIIMHRTAANRRPERCEAKALAFAGERDLRDRKDAAKVEKALAGADLDALWEALATDLGAAPVA